MAAFPTLSEMKTLLRSLGVGLLLGAGVAAGEPSATEACQEPCGARSRQLAGHTYVFPILQQSAFVTSHVGIREGLALYDIPDVPVNDLQPLDVTLTGIQQTLDLSLSITDWLGVAGYGRATIITGTNADGLLSSGATVDLLGQVGGVVRLLRSERSGTQVSVRANFGYDKGREITLLPLINAIIETPQVTVGDLINGSLGQFLFVPSEETTANGGVYAAQTLGRMFSLQGSVLAEYAWQKRKPFDRFVGNRFEQETHAVRFFFALAAALDLYPTTSVPVAVMGEYLFRTGRQEEFGRPDRTLKDSSLGLGVYYSGRANLQLGLGAVVVLNGEPQRGYGDEGSQRSSGEPTLSYGQLILRYVW
ncbi:hypothetical protein SAMN05443572_103453 [Myxococcus fulvus]|uniref:Uncharacterized protein n=2 Tax=Myxococcus fulvus TaxID=33 RepID=A0A511TEL2_MYXFU|nr:hypothetical protein MFU01_76510 [Myxococcus fulvus]SET84139.1 hypothetical protein SAMN05443572_103453 [Myxococcus fulvus]